MPSPSDLIAPVAKVVMAEDRRGDVITAAGLLVIALTLDALGLVRTSWSGPPSVPSWWFAVPAIVGCTALVWRRVHPLGALGVATVAFGADVALGGSVGLVVIVWEALYAVHLHGRPAARRVTSVGVALASLALMIAIGVITGELRAAVLTGLQAVTLLVMPMWWGANVRQGRELTAAAHERGRLERERGTALLRLAEASRHDAVRAERTAVARDLHDVIASHLSAITITSGAALAGAAEPERDRAALRSIRAESLASLQDMQAMIRVLRAETVQPGSGQDGSGQDDLGADGVGGPVRDSTAAGRMPDGLASSSAGSPSSGSPSSGSSSAGSFGAGSSRAASSGVGSVDLLAAPRAAQLAPVVEQARLAGLDLAVADPDGVLTGVTALPAAVDHAVYRVVREALTNVHKHGGARADLSFAAGDGLEIEVRDVGTGPDDSPRDRADVGGGTGIGLVSMQERVESLGGSFEAGPERARSGGTGWRVRAVLPLPDRVTAGPASSDRPTPEIRA
ncbi:histidine kinase [Promicromonospora sp. AC04]|uniref:sensor histidine kinase n=1 Tax=Promicromonospora sp. AC04 TaxID=2135723 RepID=UPI000D3A1473|nr:histidine kinase [Promicromonospora sp. AC04]PUB24291.1 histidine kinase [Promicromonospora sp. AC04]